MAARLVEQYPVGTAVCVTLDNGRSWQPGIVAAHQFPAVWVRTGDGRVWFVTNGQRIKLQSEVGGVEREE
ncbi:MAG: hypothetical protein KC413_04130 [Anaerolineales bacterium]|nr:hypothetical protein [Anaerolineales bacterium]MCA9974907.1 hypothetical protein [Anaerolineales bacterium]MCB8989216.1 hypothetical protein [Ardenticatenaceae bacterium]